MLILCLYLNFNTFNQHLNLYHENYLNIFHNIEYFMREAPQTGQHQCITSFIRFLKNLEPLHIMLGHFIYIYSSYRCLR